MREDPSKEDEFKSVDQWENQKHPDRIYVPLEDDPKGRLNQRYSFNSNSLSGNERNRLFLRHGENFSDATLVSGADDIADGRSFSILDFDQDGWQDIALMSLNAPRFKLYRNEMKRFYPENKSLRIKLQGGNSSPMPSSELSNRDGIGTKILVHFSSGKKMIIQKQSGEGFASQNSAILSVGIPTGDSVENLEIQWPSGRKTNVSQPTTAEILTIKEVQP